MKELQIVTFEQAKKLKELGFDWEIYDEFHQEYFYSKLDGYFGIYQLISHRYKDEDLIVAPTVALALKWLRVEKNIIITIGYTDNDIDDGFYFSFNGVNKEMHNYYEEAESAGVDYALDYLIEHKDGKKDS